jgi:2-dehydropantoate 2-reductase
MSRYIVVGAGAVGALLAGQLHAASIPTVLIARGGNLEALRTTGLVIHRPDSTDVIAVPVAGFPAEVQLTPDDVIVVATKTQDVEAALQDWSWQPVQGGGLAADLPVLTLHNGLAAEDAALRRFGEVYGVSMWIAATHLVAGHVVSPSWPVVGIAWIGAHVPETAGRASEFASDFERAGFLARVVDDITGVKAHKLLGNLSNALDLFDGTADEFEAVRDLITVEAERVYAAAGIKRVDPSEGTEINFGSLDIRPVPGQVGGKRSTWQSFARGRGSEVDYLNGEIVLLGRKHGIETPVNLRVQRVLGALAVAGGGAVAQSFAHILPIHSRR